MGNSSSTAQERDHEPGTKRPASAPGPKTNYQTGGSDNVRIRLDAGSNTPTTLSAASYLPTTSTTTVDATTTAAAAAAAAAAASLNTINHSDSAAAAAASLNTIDHSDSAAYWDGNTDSEDTESLLTDLLEGNSALMPEDYPANGAPAVGENRVDNRDLPMFSGANGRGNINSGNTGGWLSTLHGFLEDGNIDSGEKEELLPGFLEDFLAPTVGETRDLSMFGGANGHGNTNSGNTGGWLSTLHGFLEDGNIDSGEKEELLPGFLEDFLAPTVGETRDLSMFGGANGHGNTESPLSDYSGLDLASNPVHNQGSSSPMPLPAPPNVPVRFCRAIYNYKATESNQLSFLRGDVFRVVDSSGDWWLVTNTGGQVASVPRNFVQMADTDADAGAGADAGDDAVESRLRNLSSYPVKHRDALSEFDKINLIVLNVLSETSVLDRQKYVHSGNGTNIDGAQDIELQALRENISRSDTSTSVLTLAGFPDSTTVYVPTSSNYDSFRNHLVITVPGIEKDESTGMLTATTDTAQATLDYVTDGSANIIGNYVIVHADGCLTTTAVVNQKHGHQGPCPVLINNSNNGAAVTSRDQHFLLLVILAFKGGKTANTGSTVLNNSQLFEAGSFLQVHGTSATPTTLNPASFGNKDFTLVLERRGYPTALAGAHAAITPKQTRKFCWMLAGGTHKVNL